MVLRLLSSMLLLAAFVSFAAASSITIYIWPLSASSPSPYLEIDLPSTTGAAVQVRTRKEIAMEERELVRVGLLDSDKAWSGVVTSAASFQPGVSQKIALHSDNDGVVSHIGFSSYASKSIDQKEEVLVEVVHLHDGAQPVLNKPVVLNTDGKVDKPAQEDTRTFLQKYWWAIGIFLVLQLVGGGGKE